MEDLIAQKFRTLELGSQRGINVLLFIICGFQQRKEQNLQNLNNVTFYRLPGTSAQCIIGTEKILMQAYY